MIIFPAIDIKGGECVRLYKGDYATAHKVAENPMDTADSFKAAGAQWVHMVDLDGAKSGNTENAEIFISVAKKSGLLVELGGGIRNMNTVESYLEAGISRIILGSAAVRDPDFVKEAVKKYAEKIAVGIDARNGFVSADGWTKDSDIDYITMAKKMEEIGVKTIIFTDISKDGMLSGPNLEQLDNINKAVSCDITASGGIKDIGDIKALTEMGLYGAICGKSIYSGTLSLKEAIGVSAR
ncbi:MAG: 1-(5-phosphoribosyl)-5-[Oscillospiraceae bacterium]|nr:1-(5-phosphoribosyl)-5-[(5-phosphoribosylamino)methylideneamino]imidazole-4-carboxamide isomerase [Oscillospiraceae bacterium]